MVSFQICHFVLKKKISLLKPIELEVLIRGRIKNNLNVKNRLNFFFNHFLVKRNVSESSRTI